MYRRVSSVLAVVLLVIAAGCVGGLDGAGADEGGDGASDGADGEGGDGSDGASGDGPSASGDAALVENRTALLRAAGSYTSVWEMRFTEDGALAGRTTYTSAVDYAGERTNFRMEMVGDGETRTDYETYYADGERYQRIGDGDEATYSVGEFEFSPDTSLFSAEAQIYGAGELDEFDAAGTETFDGVTVTRYERTERPTWLSGQMVAEDGVRWDEFTYTVLVDGDGLVRSESWSAAGVDEDDVAVEMAFSYTVTGVGSTTVEEPDWAGAARESAAAQ